MCVCVGERERERERERKIGEIGDVKNDRNGKNFFRVKMKMKEFFFYINYVKMSTYNFYFDLISFFKCLSY